MKKFIDGSVNTSHRNSQGFDYYEVIHYTDKMPIDTTKCCYDESRKVLSYHNYEDAYEEYREQCNRAYRDVSFAESKHQEKYINHKICIKAYSINAQAVADDNNEEYIPAILRECKYIYRPEVI